MIRLIIKELFFALSGAIIVFFLMELIKPNMVSGYLNLNWLLIIWLANGILLLSFNKEKNN